MLLLADGGSPISRANVRFAECDATSGYGRFATFANDSGRPTDDNNHQNSLLTRTVMPEKKDQFGDADVNPRLTPKSNAILLDAL